MEEKVLFERFTGRKLIIVTAVIAVYLLLSYLLVGFKTDQVFLSLLFFAAYFGTAFTRKFILGFSIFIVYWIVFDYMKAFPNYKFNTVHIQQLYDFEKSLFGIKSGNTVLTPNEFWLQHSNKVLDIICGLFYLCWIPVPLAFALYLFVKNRPLFLKFCLTFFIVNLIGFVVYYVYPAAPPWYIQQHGAVFLANTPGNTAGLARFDAITGLDIFSSLYAKGSNVFAAMPSLHSAYPMIVLYYGIKSGARKMNFIFTLVVLGIWFAAVYTSHHYVADVIAGITCCIIGILFCNYLFGTRNFKRFLDKYLSVIK